MVERRERFRFAFEAHEAIRIRREGLRQDLQRNSVDRASYAIPCGMMYCHTIMPKTKVALTLDADLLDQVDELVARQKFRNRSQAVEAALADKLRRLARTRLARETAKLNPAHEKRLADEGLDDTLDAWPEY